MQSLHEAHKLQMDTQYTLSEYEWKSVFNPEDVWYRADILYGVFSSFLLMKLTSLPKYFMIKKKIFDQQLFNVKL